MSDIKWQDYTNEILLRLDTEAFFLGELKNIDRRGDEVKAECPFKNNHLGGTDKNPSFTVNLSKGVYYCNVCHAKGNAHTLYSHIYNVSSNDAWMALGDALSIERPDSDVPSRPPIDVGIIASYRQSLAGLTGPIRDVLTTRRGLTQTTIDSFQMGWDGERITIPIYDERNELVNIRRYKWNSQDDKYKVLNYEDKFGNTYGELRIYGIENFVDNECDYVVWGEGELDRIIAEQYGFHSACPTSGAGKWKREWLGYFKRKKRVYLVMDNDEAGMLAVKELAPKISQVTKVFIVKWPDDYKVKGDITDFFVEYQKSKEDFQALLDAAEEYGVIPDVPDEEVDQVLLADSSSAAYVNKRIRVPIMLSGKDAQPYICPIRIKMFCHSYSEDNKQCAGCMLATYAGEITKDLTAKDKEILKLIRCTDAKQETEIKAWIGVPQRCCKFLYDIEQNDNIEEIRMIPKAEANFGFSKGQEYVVRNGFFLGVPLQANKRYMMYGFMYPDPNTQYATYVFDKAIPEKDVISDFEMNEEVHEQLKIFQVAEGQTIDQKMKEIHKDLERNVTYIWERQEIAISVDLVYHTCLNFYFQEQFVKRGWAEVLIIGDSGQAKTTVVERLMQHYRLGELHSGESSRRTGLVYSLQQNGKRWFLVWGALPLNDGGLITIDELSGLSEDDLAIMSDVRSSGIARSTGVITAETTARTRCIYISNPRNGRPLNTETYGVQSVLKLFGKTEDVRRLDFAVAVASGDVSPDLVNIAISEKPTVTHIYNSDLCNLRVLWAWSRRPEQIQFTPEATALILKHASEMGKKYSSKVPLVEAADQRLKIARLSVSCACCTFSTEDGEMLIVKPEHVEYVYGFLTDRYSTKNLSYDKFSLDEAENSDMSDENFSRLREEFSIIVCPDHNALANTLYQLSYFNRNSLEDYTGLTRDDLRTLLKFLTGNHLIERVHSDYRRQPLGTEFLESILLDPYTPAEIKKFRSNVYAQYDM